MSEIAAVLAKIKHDLEGPDAVGGNAWMMRASYMVPRLRRTVEQIWHRCSYRVEDDGVTHWPDPLAAIEIREIIERELGGQDA